MSMIPESTRNVFLGRQVNIKLMEMPDNIPNVQQGARTSSQISGQLSEDNEDKDVFTFPITELYVLQELDLKLSHNNCLEIMEKSFSSLIGTDGTGRGEVLGRKIASQLMSWDLMAQMSWTGISRTPGCEKKFAFQTLENIFRLFYRVLIKADSTWSIEKNENLFSGSLLKHAKMRAQAQEKQKIKRYLHSERLCRKL